MPWTNHRKNYFKVRIVSNHYGLVGDNPHDKPDKPKKPHRPKRPKKPKKPKRPPKRPPVSVPDTPDYFRPPNYQPPGGMNPWIPAYTAVGTAGVLSSIFSAGKYLLPLL